MVRDDVPGGQPYRSAMGIGLTARDTTIETVYLWHTEPGVYGGTHAIAMIPNTDTESAHHTLERIRRACESAVVPDLPRPVTCSIGLAVTGTNGFLESIEQVIDRAERALYTVKRNGRNRVEFFAAPPVASPRAVRRSTGTAIATGTTGIIL